MNHPEDWQRTATAYHEAGHAVVRCVLGFGPKSAKIVPKYEVNGIAQCANPLRGIKLDTDGSSGRALLRLMYPSLAVACLKGSRYGRNVFDDENNGDTDITVSSDGEERDWAVFVTFSLPARRLEAGRTSKSRRSDAPMNKGYILNTTQSSIQTDDSPHEMNGLPDANVQTVCVVARRRNDRTSAGGERNKPPER
jgi:hypothetical protein